MKVQSMVAVFISLLVASRQQQEDELIFLVIGDWGEDFYWDVDSPQMLVSAAMNNFAAEHNVSFILTTGDNFYEDGVRSPNDAYFNQKWKQVYNGEHIKNIQWRIALGNHDYYPLEDRPGPNAGGNEMFQLKRNGIDPQWYLPDLWYKFTESSPAGDVDFFVIDTEAIVEQFNNYTDQYVWFEQELAASKAVIKLVVGHHNIYTVGADAPGVPSLWDVVEPMMLEYNVDAYFCGHDHSMSHLWYTNGTGHDYIISAGGGTDLNDENVFWSNYFRTNWNLESTFYSEHGFAAVFINENVMRVDMMDFQGELLFDIIRPVAS